MATSSRITQRDKAQIISHWFVEHNNEFIELKLPPRSPDVCPIERPWDLVEQEICITGVQLTNLQQFCDVVMSM